MGSTKLSRRKTNISRTNKQRGRLLQQEVRELILESFPELEPDDCRSTSMGASGEDVQLSPLARRALGGIQLECKRVKTLKTIDSWLKQAQSHGPHKPVVVTRADHEKPLAILLLSDYIELTRELHNSKRER